jgi:hypothetical protein
MSKCTLSYKSMINYRIFELLQDLTNDINIKGRNIDHFIVVRNHSLEALKYE